MSRLYLSGDVARVKLVLACQHEATMRARGAFVTAEPRAEGLRAAVSCQQQLNTHFSPSPGFGGAGVESLVEAARVPEWPLSRVHCPRHRTQTPHEGRTPAALSPRHLGLFAAAPRHSPSSPRRRRARPPCGSPAPQRPCPPGRSGLVAGANTLHT